MKRIYIFKTGNRLYRYDLNDQLPFQWSSEYKNIEYRITQYGPKNAIGAFFFYCSEQTANEVKDNAIINFNKKRWILPSHYYITSCYAKYDINLLDLRNLNEPIDLIDAITNEGIDILNKNFIRYDLKEDPTFATIKKSFDNWKAGISQDYNRSTINEFFHKHIGYSGQILTDFDNGIEFKRQLEANNLDGYIFNEASTSTVCLFSPEKLSPPVHESHNIE